MTKPSTAGLNIGVAAVSFAVLTLELSMIRVMSVILAPSTGYMALTSAMFALGLGGVYLYLFPVKPRDISRQLAWLSLAFAVTAPLIILVFNTLPFGFEIRRENLLVQGLCWSGMYIALILPFFVAGLALAMVFQNYSESMDRLYFFDLVAAGIACLVFIPLLPDYGPGGLIFVAAAAAVVACASFHQPGRAGQVGYGTAAAALVAVPFMVEGYIEFEGHANKRNNDRLIADGARMMVQWDPVSKLDVFNRPDRNALLFSIDGGSQGSWLGKFDGDYERIREDRSENAETYYAGKNSIAHYFIDQKGIEPEVLIIGSAAGGEVRKAISYGARRVDAVELVGAIMSAERNEFADFGSGVYNHPKVNPVAGEGRSFLRSTDKRYDIIQMFSNHTTSSVTQGTNATGINYLQTVQAYREYFRHMTDEGVLQINHHVWPRMLTTAAQAWEESGRSDFWRHALVIESFVADTLPTLLIKMRPWTQNEVDTVLSYSNRQKVNEFNRPAPSRPSPRVHAGYTLETELVAYAPEVQAVQMVIGTHHQPQLDYDITVEVLDDTGQVLRTATIDGDTVRDNSVSGAVFRPLETDAGKKFTVRVSAPGAIRSNGFSIWISDDGEPSMNFFPGEKASNAVLTFDPVNTAGNLVPNEFLQAPFPYDEAETLPWDITPATDFDPFFNMIRKRASRITAGDENMLDRNTAHLLNTRLAHGYPSDWIHLIVVAAVSLALSLVFVALPLLRTRVRDAAWSGMSRDIAYFSCLGLGFIMFQVVFIQLFHKLIGFPVHTFVLVISTMLVSAGLGSMYCRRFIELFGQRTWMIFAIIVGYAIAFVLSFQLLFEFLLAFPLAVRLAAGAAMIAPLSFFMGMPFPIGIMRLGENQATAIPWAWALNGFFTVAGGYLAIVIALFSNFVFVLGLAALIYACAALVVRDAARRQPAPAF